MSSGALLWQSSWPSHFLTTGSMNTNDGYKSQEKENLLPPATHFTIYASWAEVSSSVNNHIRMDECKNQNWTPTWNLEACVGEGEDKPSTIVMDFLRYLKSCISSVRSDVFIKMWTSDGPLVSSFAGVQPTMHSFGFIVRRRWSWTQIKTFGQCAKLEWRH